MFYVGMYVVLCPLSLSHMLDTHSVDVALITEHKLLTDKVFDDRNKAADVDYRQFWKLLRKNKDIKSSVCTALKVNDVCHSNDNVISGFSNYFKGIFSTTVVDNAAKEHVARM